MADLDFVSLNSFSAVFHLSCALFLDRSHKFLFFFFPSECHSQRTLITHRPRGLLIARERGKVFGEVVCVVIVPDMLTLCPQTFSFLSFFFFRGPGFEDSKNVLKEEKPYPPPGQKRKQVMREKNIIFVIPIVMNNKPLFQLCSLTPRGSLSN